jgi:Protein of unknown function (DUF3175)
LRLISQMSQHNRTKSNVRPQLFTTGLPLIQQSLFDLLYFFTRGCDLPSKKKQRKSKKRWVRGVATESTFPKKGIFTKDAETIARHMASKKVSPKGVGSGIRMIQYFINRAGRSLSATRRRELEKAKRILQDRRTRPRNR